MATTVSHPLPTTQAHAIAGLTGYEDADTLRWQPPCTGTQDGDAGTGPDGRASRGPAPTGNAASWPTSEAPASMNVKLKVGNMELMYTARDTNDRDLQDRMTTLLPWLAGMTYRVAGYHEPIRRGVVDAAPGVQIEPITGASALIWAADWTSGVVAMTATVTTRSSTAARRRTGATRYR